MTGAVSNAQGEVEFVWNAPYEGTLSCNECPNPIATPQYTIDYELYAIDENGCDDTDLLRVIVEKPKLAVVPTGFTPNGDNMNDILRVHGRPGTQVILFQLFDRWGELVYEDGGFPVNDENRGWDGQFRGQMMNPDVFVWVLTVLHEDGTEETLRGQTTLIR
ncbi:MAG: gliding motility-associated C-terminal domain-containing protein [Saprospiraceae bacterium]